MTPDPHPPTSFFYLFFFKKPEQFAYFWVAILSLVGLTAETGAHTSQPHIILLLIGSTWADEQLDAALKGGERRLRWVMNLSTRTVLKPEKATLRSAVLGFIRFVGLARMRKRAKINQPASNTETKILSWYTTWNISSIFWICLQRQWGKKPMENIWKRETTKKTCFFAFQSKSH